MKREVTLQRLDQSHGTPTPRFVFFSTDGRPRSNCLHPGVLNNKQIRLQKCSLHQQVFYRCQRMNCQEPKYPLQSSAEIAKLSNVEHLAQASISRYFIGKPAVFNIDTPLTPQSHVSVSSPKWKRVSLTHAEKKMNYRSLLLSLMGLDRTLLYARVRSRKLII